MEQNTCQIDHPHCEQCGRDDYEATHGDQGYSGCCNELIPFSSYSCRGFHAEETNR